MIREKELFSTLRGTVLWLVVGSMLAVPGVIFGHSVQVYPYRVDPRKHPDDIRRYTKPPSRSVFKNRLQFMTIRIMDDDYKKNMDMYEKDGVGKVIWPFYPMLYSDKFKDMIQEIKKRDFYLFDMWGFVPGSGPGVWRQFPVPDGALEYMQKELGDRWLGMDVGEQDGRYVGGHAKEQVPYGVSHEGQYLNFQHHFQKMTDLLGNKMATLVSLNFGHYFLKEGSYTMIGAETAQCLPNSQVYYAFIRGAGKQYGVPWFGNVSVYNRWGYKRYPTCVTSGTSLSLMKRLYYTQILYNSLLIGYEGGYYYLHTDKLSPIGRLQQQAGIWSEKNGDPGTMYTPVALMLDFFSGWSFPRHFYTPCTYRTWGVLPYGMGDYLTDDLLRLIYPTYADSSYYITERGYSSPTPFGDIADCLLSDAPGWVLAQYPVLVLAGEMRPGAELSETLQKYVANGGHLVMTAANALRLFPEGIAGIKVLPETLKAESDKGTVTLHRMTLADTAEVARKTDGAVTVARGNAGKGKVTVFASPFGLVEEPQCKLPVKSEINQSLPVPYPLLPDVEKELADIFRGEMIFSADKNGGLAVTTCRRKEGEYTVSISNPDWEEKPFAIEAKAGTIKKIVELPTDTEEQKDIGYQPRGWKKDLGKDTPTTIAGGSIRIFRVFMDEKNGPEKIDILPETNPTPNPVGSGLFLPQTASIQRDILLRPTFFRHFDTVMVDWRYVSERDIKALRAQSGWLKRQGVKIVVDLSSGCNLFADLRTIENDPKPYAESIETILDLFSKMAALGAKDLIVSLHRAPENNYSGQQWLQSQVKTFRMLSEKAAALGITLHLRQNSFKSTPTLVHLEKWVKRINEPNFKAAPSLAALFAPLRDKNYQKIAETLADLPCDLVLASGYERDMHNQLWSLHRPLTVLKDRKALKMLIAAVRAAKRTVILDALYTSPEEEYQDSKLINPDNCK